MKKTLKILSIILISISLFMAFGQPISLAKKDPGEIINSAESSGNEMGTGLDSVTGTIINWLWGISIVVAIVVVMVIGIKFIIGSTQEKAEYKKSLIPLVVGVVLVVFATTLVKFLFSMG